ncbi:MAG: hypothetical protein ACREQ8_02825 [Woeseiaceae bacterium]
MCARLKGTLVAAALLIAFFSVLPEPGAPQPAEWPTVDGNTFALRGVRVFDGEALHESVDLLVEDGIITMASPKLPIPDGIPQLAADGYTLLPAEKVGSDGRARIAPGMPADFMLAAGDPLADVTATRNIVAIWKNGYRTEPTRPSGATLRR